MNPVRQCRAVPSALAALFAFTNACSGGSGTGPDDAAGGDASPDAIIVITGDASVGSDAPEVVDGTALGDDGAANGDSGQGNPSDTGAKVPDTGSSVEGGAAKDGSVGTPDAGLPIPDSGADATAPGPCAANNGGCSAHASCTPVGGSAQCTCNPGFVGNGTTCNAADLTVAINAVPGLAGNVTVTGPNSFTSTISQTTSWAGLVPGDYSVQAVPARRPLPVVDELYLPTPTSQSVHVPGGGAAATASLAYSLRPGTGAVWIGSYGTDRVVSYEGTGLLAGASPTSLSLSVAAHAGPEATAIDSAGNLWVSNLAARTVQMFAAADLGSATAIPKVTLTFTSAPGDVAFDAHGNLWVSAYSGSVFRFDAANLTSGAATPAATIAVAKAYGLALDSSGNLWVSSVTAAGAGSTIRIDNPGALTGTVASVTSSVTLAQAGQIVFDAGGNLWLLSAGLNCAATVFMYPVASLASGAPAPAIVADGFPCAASLAFDNAGALWVADTADGGSSQLAEFLHPSTLPASGTPTADAVVQIPAVQLDGPRITFNPPATNLPIAQ